MIATVFGLAISVCFLGILVRAVRRQQLREQTALMWVAIALAMIFISATLPLHLLSQAARLVGIAYPPELLLLLAVVVLMVLVLHLSVALVRLSDRQTKLAQELGLLTASQPAAEAAGRESGE
jgi:hypothetical protein